MAAYSKSEPNYTYTAIFRLIEIEKVENTNRKASRLQEGHLLKQIPYVAIVEDILF